MQKYNTEYKDYSGYIAVMISTDRQIFNERSAVRARMIDYSKLYKELHIIIFSTKKNDTQNISNNCVIYSTNSYVRWNYISDARKIGKKIIKKIDQNQPILITCQDPFETALVGKCLANLRRNAEFLIQIHVDLFSPYFSSFSFLNKIRLFISKFTLPYAQNIRVVSNKIADSLVQKGIQKEEIIVKPIDINIDAIKNTQPAFDLKNKFPQFEKIVLMASRLEKEKNIDMAIKAWKKVLSNRSRNGLVIVGSGGEMSKLKKLSHKLRINDSVIFVGWETDLVPYYKGCDIFLLTSWYEGYGMTLKEAQAAGCKIVSTDVGVAREVGAKIVSWTEQSIADSLIENL